MPEELLYKNMHLKQELSNNAYDVVSQALEYTKNKLNYKKYDTVKLLIALYEKDYSYVSSKNDYRDQLKILDEYFYNQYGHSVITLEILKTILTYKGSEYYDSLVHDIVKIEALLRTNTKNSKINEEIFLTPLKEENYDKLMNLIENSLSMKYAVAIIYDKIKNKAQ